MQWVGSRHVCLQPPFLPTLRPLLIVFMSSSGCLFTPRPLPGRILLGRTTTCMWGPAGGVLVTLRVPGGATRGNRHWIREDRHGALPRRHIPRGSGPPGSQPRSKSRHWLCLHWVRLRVRISRRARPAVPGRGGCPASRYTFDQRAVSVLHQPQPTPGTATGQVSRGGHEVGATLRGFHRLVQATQT